ncbi:MAG: glycosyltransferase family 4 protein [Acidobacteria bacterium]|nr:glycosyltransferase family 4 protein [Acidobacteriota bacterium]
MAQPRTIIVATASPPFAEGGHLVMARELVGALLECGHDATLLVTPQNRFGRQASAYLAAWCTDVSVAHEGRKVDQVISLRYPAYAVRHDNHVVWLNHRMREYYDLWDQFSVHLSVKAGVKERVRRALIHRVDRHLLTKRVRDLYVISATVQARLRRWGGYESKVLYPPPPKRAYRNDDYGDYLFGVSRLTPLKRFDLVLRALAEPIASGIRCVIAGEGAQLEALVRLRRQLDLDDRVDFTGRIGEQELLEHLGRCRAVVFPTFNEDYGFVTVEAFASGKAVLTCRDSGGPAELVRNGVNGFVVDPTAESLARAMRAVMNDRTLAVRLGEAGAADAAKMTWADAVAQLLRT